MNNDHARVVIGGMYSHYKTGNMYRVLCIAKHSETLEDLVVYEALYISDTSQHWVRPLSMFLEAVEWNGARVPRFTLIS